MKNSLKYLNCAVVIAAFILCCTNAAQAQSPQGILERFKKPMPELKLLPEDEFKKATRLDRRTPYGLRDLAYEIRVPSHWTDGDNKASSNFQLNDRLFLELSSYYGKPTISGRSRIEIQALNIATNMTAEQWYLTYILESGFTTEGLVTHSDNKAESLLIVMDGDATYYVRTLTVINGQRVIMVRYYVPIHYMNQEAAMQEQVISSFRLLNEVGRVDAPTKTYRLLDVAELNYPDDWTIYATPQRSVDRMYTTVLNVDEKKLGRGRIQAHASKGKMDVSVTSSFIQPSILDEVDVYKKRLESSGALLGERIPFDEEIEYNEYIDFGLTEVYQAISGGNDASKSEYWITVMLGANYYYFISLLTPSREDNFPVWASNTQDYKVAVRNFSLLSGAFIDRE